MRFRIIIHSDRPQAIPVNYQYPLSAWIYKVFNRADPAFAQWLHDHGYAFNGNRRYKLFTFSWLRTPSVRLDKQRKALVTRPGSISFLICFHIEEAAARFIQGVFTDQELSIASLLVKGDFQVTAVERLPDPAFTTNEAEFETLSPVVVTRPRLRGGKLMAKYLHPEDQDYDQYLLDNLVKRYATAQNRLAGIIQEGPYTEAIADMPFDTPDLRWTLCNRPVKRGQLIKEGRREQTQVIGYNYKFRLEAPAELLRFVWDAGIGEKGSLGFGCLEVATIGNEIVSTTKFDVA